MGKSEIGFPTFLYDKGKGMVKGFVLREKGENFYVTGEI